MNYVDTKHIRHLFTEDDRLVRELFGDQLESLRQFTRRLESYDGNKESFRVIIYDCLVRFDLKAKELAALCGTSHTTVTRWAKDTVPTELARVEAVKRIKQRLESRLGELTTVLPSSLVITRLDGRGDVDSPVDPYDWSKTWE